MDFQLRLVVACCLSRSSRTGALPGLYICVLICQLCAHFGQSSNSKLDDFVRPLCGSLVLKGAVGKVWIGDRENEHVQPVCPIKSVCNLNSMAGIIQSSVIKVKSLQDTTV